VRDLCTVIAPRLPAEARLEQHLGVLPSLVCDRAAVGQMLLNLLDNALRALNRNGCIEVATRAEVRSLVLTVSDDGAGIAATDLPHVFEPFFTRRPVGQGAGLGLTVARDIAQAHGGHLALDSTPGGGTRVRVTLPLGTAGGDGS
jgi:signal transduction histidine kinase